jgi:hypothetical protein
MADQGEAEKDAEEHGIYDPDRRSVRVAAMHDAEYGRRAQHREPGVRGPDQLLQSIAPKQQFLARRSQRQNGQADP